MGLRLYDVREQGEVRRAQSVARPPADEDNRKLRNGDFLFPWYAIISSKIRSDR